MKPCVFAADSSPSLLESIHISFQSAGFDIYTSRIGGEVMKLISETEPDVILLGLSLPGKNGYELARGINQHDKFREIPLFLLTGTFEEADSRQLSGLAYEDVITGPVDTGALAARIKDILNEKSEPKSLPEEPESVLHPEGHFHFEKAWQEKEKEFREFIAKTVRKEVLEAERELEKRLKGRKSPGAGSETEG